MPRKERRVFEDLTRGEIRSCDCVTCGAPTRHKVVAARNVQVDESEGDFSIYLWDDYEIVECQGCQTISFRHAHRDTENVLHTEDMKAELIDDVSVYPPRSIRKTSLGDAIELPFPMRSLYLETCRALDAGLHHLVALAFSPLMEATMKDQAVPGRSVFHRIDAAAKRGLVTAAEAEILHKVRDIRNAADHEAERPLDSSTMAAFEVLERLLSRIYVEPNIADRLKRRGPPKGGWC